MPTTMPTVAAPPPAPDVLDAEFTDAPPRHLRDHLRVLVKYRWLAGTLCGLVLGATVLWTLATPRQYAATARLQVTRESPIQLRLAENVLDLEGQDRAVGGGSSFLATQVAVLQSRDLAERVLRTYAADGEATAATPLADRPGLLALGGRLLAAVRPRGWEEDGTPAGGDAGAGGGEPTPAQLDRYRDWLSVREVRGTDLVEVRFTTPSARLSAFLAGAHAQAYLDANEEVRLAANATAKDFLGRQLEEARGRVEQAEAALSTFAAAHPEVAVSEEHKLLPQRLAELTTGVTKAERTRVGLESRYGFLSDPAADPLAFFLDRAGVQKVRLAELEVRAEEAALATRLGPNHPQIVELGRHAAALQRQLRGEVEREVSGVRQQWEAARRKEAALRAVVTHQESDAIALRELGARYELLRRDADTAHALHRSLLMQQLETGVHSELAASNVRIVERPEVPMAPSSPNVPLALALGLAGGVVVAVGAAFACEYFDSSLKSGAEVSEALALAPLATIPNFAAARRSASAAGLSARAGGGLLPAPDGPGPELVVVHEPASVVAEAFRALRTAVLFSAAAETPRVLLVTSAGAGEGKTVSSLNLATTLADAGARVCVVDVDLRRPACHRALRLTNERGLSTVLSGQAGLEDVLRTLPSPRLDVLTAGPTPPNPAEMVGSARMRALLQTLRERYDFVVLDSPPTLPVTDSVILARDADGVVLVVKGHDTPRELARRARDLLAASGAHLLGAVVNNVDLGWGELGYYQRYYGYHRVEEVAA
ncbi:MAG: polysaccharide biosynthesis tyrosine autokinase [bacterium]|nr:polysaccharide biosynthesis tyrosine autokinase [bacterium]